MSEMSVTQPPQFQFPAVREIAIPNHYFNGYQIALSMSDMNIMMLLDGQPVARLSLSFTTAKSLAHDLNKAVESFEQATEHNIMMIEEVKTAFDKQQK